MAENNDELLDYEEQEDQEDQVADGIGADATARRDVKGTYVSIHSSGFRDFLLKPELLRAIVDCGFEHPSEGLLIAVFIMPFAFESQVSHLTVCSVIDSLSHLDRLPKISRTSSHADFLLFIASLALVVYKKHARDGSLKSFF